jgi:hypothetical protein
MAARLKMAQEMTTSDWVAYQRRHPRPGDPPPGIPPRTDAPAAGPSREELVAAGFARPRRQVPDRTSRKAAASTAELIEDQDAARRREIRQLEAQLEYVQKGGVANRARREEKLRYEIAELKRQLT